MMTLIGIQDEFIATINIAWARWSHRKGLFGDKRPGGHFPRIRGAAYRKATAALAKLTFTATQIKQILSDAEDMAELERNATMEA